MRWSPREQVLRTFDYHLTKSSVGHRYEVFPVDELRVSRHGWAVGNTMGRNSYGLELGLGVGQILLTRPLGDDVVVESAGDRLKCRPLFIVGTR